MEKDPKRVITADQVFQFSSSASLEKLTGHKAHNLAELFGLIQSCPDSSIFYHTFSAFRILREVQVPYTNGFAMWISESVNDEALAEKLASIDLTEHNTIASLRGRILETIEAHKKENPETFHRTATKPFYLLDVIRIVYLTDKFAYDLRSFRDLLHTISVDSVYFHFIESRLYTQLESDDFSRWIEESLNLGELSQQIRAIDINVYTLEELREKIVKTIDEFLENTEG
ncbi:MAG: hypothetical protein GTN74_14400 [Proteobacteria bacterium]|nr:hypothetical protein [Pseudomonadota bacterium]NIS71722.1 hypothetical protein [Pseudomonadota bacterium]